MMQLSAVRQLALSLVNRLVSLLPTTYTPLQLLPEPPRRQIQCRALPF